MQNKSEQLKNYWLNYPLSKESEAFKNYKQFLLMNFRREILLDMAQELNLSWFALLSLSNTSKEIFSGVDALEPYDKILWQPWLKSYFPEHALSDDSNIPQNKISYKRYFFK